MSDFPPLLYSYLTVLVTFAGACIGSFLNVCIYRIPRSESVAFPGSHCPGCGHPIAWYDNVPILSYLLLGRKCRHCQKPISPRYAIVEAVTALLFLGVWLQYGLTPVTPIYLLMVCGLLLATFVDLEHMIIPDRVSIGGMLIGLVLSAAVPALHGKDQAWAGLLTSLIGLVAGGGSLWLVAVLGKMAFKKDAMGFGDVKLLGAIGAFLGWQGVLFTVMLSSLLGSVIGLLFIIGGRHEWQSKIPYGPYLALGALIWTLWGVNWWEAYIHWMSGSY
jgi:leader peptidase (prepilin peptidase) / N-methyltransferase